MACESEIFSIESETEAETLRLLLGRGVGFRLGSGLRRIYDQPLGGELLLSHEIRSLDIDEKRMLANPVEELLRLWGERKEICLRVIARATCRGREEHLNEDLLRERCDGLRRDLDEESGPTLLAAVLRRGGSGRLQDLIGLGDEQRLQARIGELRGEESGMIGFGGRSVFGRLIDRACARYGWTYDYTVWGISLGALEMLLADQVSGIYVSDDERRKLGLCGIGEINGDEASIEELKELTE